MAANTHLERITQESARRILADEVTRIQQQLRTLWPSLETTAGIPARSTVAHRAYIDEWLSDYADVIHDRHVDPNDTQEMPAVKGD